MTSGDERGPADRHCGAETAAIFVGGEGKRMGGTDKAALMVRGRPIVERQLAVLAPLFRRVVFVGEPRPALAQFGLTFVRDRHGPRLGPLAALEAVLAWLPNADDAVVCLAGDLPFLEPALITWLRDTQPDAACLVPRTARGPEPLCARYSKVLLPVVEDQLSRGPASLQALLERAQTRFIEESELRRHDPELRTFTNVNTQDELDAANRRAG